MPSHARAKAFAPLRSVWSAPANRSVRPDWSAYATAYDLMCEHNPAYQALLQDFETFLASIETPRVIHDIGGGTGNFSKIAARAYGASEIHFVEPDAGMITLARAKLAAHANVTFVNLPLQALGGAGTADLVICVHALYAMPAQEQRLRELRRMLRPGGWLYLVDLGRHIDVADWRSFLFSHLKNERGLAGALRIFWQGREVARQNANILKAQIDGVYWTHSEAQIEAVVAGCGFDIVRQQSVYRGYSDLLVCRAGM